MEGGDIGQRPGALHFHYHYHVALMIPQQEGDSREGGWAVMPIPQKCMFFKFLIHFLH